MSQLHYKNAQLQLENVHLTEIAKKYGTPCYVYSKTALVSNWQRFQLAFNSIPHLICYAVKANSNIHILKILSGLDAGFDIVSAGELYRVLKANGDHKKIIFSGVGKRSDEIEYAIKQKIYCFNIESQAELIRLHSIANKKKIPINIAIRVNPNINPNTHSHIATGLKENKFGIDINEVIPLAKKIVKLKYINLVGLACHIGSQITSITPFIKTLKKLQTLYHELESMNIQLQHLDIGGGLGIIYANENPPSIENYAHALSKHLTFFPGKILLEPGRAMIGDAGVLLTRVQYLKHNAYRNFAIVDAGMTELIRPALYDAWQAIYPVKKRGQLKKTYDIMGPVCESADFLGKDRKLAIAQDDLLVIDTVGAYGFSMSSNYNSRPRCAEVLVDDNKYKCIRRRETLADLVQLEI